MKLLQGIEVTPTRYSVQHNGESVSSYIIFSKKSSKYFVIPDGIEGTYINNKTNDDEYVSILNSSLPDTFHDDYGFDTQAEAVGALLKYHKLL